MEQIGEKDTPTKEILCKEKVQNEKAQLWENKDEHNRDEWGTTEEESWMK